MQFIRRAMTLLDRRRVARSAGKEPASKRDCDQAAGTATKVTGSWTVMPNRIAQGFGGKTRRSNILKRSAYS
jgi:hypothetical protein